MGGTNRQLSGFTEPRRVTQALTFTLSLLPRSFANIPVARGMARKVGKPLGISLAREDEEGMVSWAKC